jgi:hypothetical protein
MIDVQCERFKVEEEMMMMMTLCCGGKSKKIFEWIMSGW